jgi:hypothetical protein
MATQGIDVRQTTGQLIFRAFLLDSTGALVTSGTTSLVLWELQDSGALFTYDFADNTFKSGAVTTLSLAMTHRRLNNNLADSGYWTAVLSTLTDFEVGRIYGVRIVNIGATPDYQCREFQFGNAEGDMTVTAARLNVNVEAINTDTTAADRLDASLTNAAGGIDLNLEQALDLTPVGDSVGEALFNGLSGGGGGGPVDLNLDQLLDLTPTANTVGEALYTALTGGGGGGGGGGEDILLSTTAATGSTTTSIILTSVPGTDANDDFNGHLVILTDASDSNRRSASLVTDYVASTNTLTIAPPCLFTPANLDPVVIIANAESTTAAELLKLSTGFSAANPNNLISYLRAIMSKAATNPAGVGTYTAATDSLEAIREREDLITGAGFSTGTDSLAAIRQAIDDLIAPAIVSSSSAGGVGFLSECVSLVRKITDEPGVVPKYTDGDIIEYVQNAMDHIVSVINTDTDHPILVRYDVDTIPSVQEYLLPVGVAQVWRVAAIDAQTSRVLWEEYPSNEFSSSFRGFSIEGNILRFNSLNRTMGTLQILYLPNSEATMFTADLDVDGGASTFTLPSTVIAGAVDNRDGIYNGHIVRVIAGPGAGQERSITADVAGVLSVTPPWETVPLAENLPTNEASTVEIVPQYSRMIKHVVCLHASLDILANEAKSTRRGEVERRLQHKMATLRQTLGRKVNRFGSRGPGVDTDDNYENWNLFW